LQPDLERELIRKCKSGDARFYEPLVRAYEPTGLRLAVAMRRPFGPWFFQILRNQCRDMLRSRKAKFRMEAVDERLEERPADGERGPERRRQRNAARDVLWRGLEQIGPEHREILVLKELEGFRYGEIAQILEIPEGTVASRLYHARHALREALEQMNVEYP